jgi:AraC-like DNA-binding protein
MIQESEIIHQLSRLAVYQNFERAFCEVTGLSVRLRPLGIWNLACAALHQEPQFFNVTVVPVRLGEKIIGVLQTGRVAVGVPMAEQFAGQDKQTSETTARRRPNEIGNGHLPVFSRSRYEAMVHLLQIFAEQLSFFANQIVMKLDEREPYRVRLARAFISNHQADNINLADVARASHVSTFHLCKIFKRATGLTFIEYRNRLRIESAKELLLNPNLNVSEVAYSVGFQSLTQFNRLFRRVVGRAPTGFRSNLTEQNTPRRSDENCLPDSGRNRRRAQIQQSLGQDRRSGVGAFAYL